MSDIRFVCLSDLHLGQDQSVLTALRDFEIDPAGTAPTLRALGACLRDIVSRNKDQTRKPTLILLGDVIELALTEADISSAVFVRFLEQIFTEQEPLFERIVYVPGNHDHHVWETTREFWWVTSIAGSGNTQSFPTPWHTTGIFSQSAPRTGRNPYVQTLLERLPYSYIRSYPVETAYPNFGVRSRDGRRAVVFHHGHYLESAYHLMSEVMGLIFPRNLEGRLVGKVQRGVRVTNIPPKTVDDLETQNFAWIDFLWSSLGRSGEVGNGLEMLYDKLADPVKLAPLVDNVVAGLIGKLARPGFFGRILLFVFEKTFLRWVVHGVLSFIADRERERPDTLLSDDSQKLLAAYIQKNGLLYRAIVAELGALPAELSFVFGHTHKPYESVQTFDGLAQPVPVYNTGGWAIDPSLEPQPLHGGAAIVVDEDCNLASLRLFNEEKSAGAYKVGVQAAGDTANNSLYQRLVKEVDPTAAPYKDFSAAAAAAVAERFELSRRIIGVKKA